MDPHSKILELAAQKGPLIPADVSKELNINQLFSSAMLSELVEDEKLKISHVKVGGSPLYYLPGHEDKLQDFYKKLPEKEQKTYLLLKENKVLADTELEPLYRVAIRQIKDFAKPLQVEMSDGPLIFWKWYLLSNQEAEVLIKKKISQLKHSNQNMANTAESMVDETDENKNTTEKNQTIQNTKLKTTKPIKTTPISSSSKKETQSVSSTQTQSEAVIKDGSDVIFQERVDNYIKSKGITIIECEVIKKSSEIDYILLIPSPLGNLKYYCKAKDKQKPTDMDLGAAYMKGEMKKLPVLFITTGEFTKKGKDSLSNEFKNIVVHKIE